MVDVIVVVGIIAGITEGSVTCGGGDGGCCCGGDRGD